MKQKKIPAEAQLGRRDAIAHKENVITITTTPTTTTNTQYTPTTTPTTFSFTASVLSKEINKHEAGI